MAKFEEVFEDTQYMFDQAINDAGLTQNVNITLLSNNKAKELFKVNKANELLKHRAGDDVIIVLNEKIFEQLTPEQKMIVVEEAIAYISYDYDNEKIVITPPDFIAHSGLLRKHTFNKIDVIRESVKTLYQVEKDAEEEAKSKTK